MKLEKELFDHSIEGKQTSLHFLQNKNMQVAITNYGARIVAIILQDKNKKPIDVVVGFDSINGYLRSTETYHGTIVGRYANRIAGGKFLLDGKEYRLSVNNPPNHLHGGPKGFHNQVWDIKKISANGVQLSYFSKDGEENYPGNLQVMVEYSLSEKNELGIRYEATTDSATVINLTSHPFFNLNGIGSGTIENHLLWIHADNYNPVNEALIPTGIFSVNNTPFDFRNKMTIGKQINDENVQLKYGAGYDHNFVLNENGMRTVAKATGDKTGIGMEVITDQPGMQLYSGNYMKSENRIKWGFVDDFRTAFCLETQHFPDSPNHPEFPSTVLRPGENFKSETVYKFTS
ncbi:MAG: aldose epimerase family protein [Flavisolibacter sp.]